MAFESIFSADGATPAIQGMAPLVLAGLVVLFYVFGRGALFPGLPLIRLDDKAPTSLSAAQKEWNADAHGIIRKGLEQVKGAFQVVTAIGPRIILPNRYVDEIKNDPHLSFSEAIANEFFSDYPGFEAFATLRQRDVLQETIRVRLTQSLSFITEDLAEEATDAFHDIFGESEEWKEMTLKPAVMDAVARVSSRVFIGPEGSRNEQWLDMSKRYTVDSFAAARQLRTWSPWLRPLVHRFLPACARLRDEVRDARRILEPIVRARREGMKDPEKVADAIGWMDEAARGRPFDVAAGQLALALAATHTTTDLTTLCLFRLCEGPEWVGRLREEVVGVVGVEGWTKAALQRMRLMDSFVKETQRLQQGTRATFMRLAKEQVTLSDGTVIPKNATLMASTERQMDPELFADPESFDGKRFLDLRGRPGEENKWQLTTTSGNLLGFGHGTHACPGRFFAANEIKVLLVFMLMKYEWKFPEGQGMPKMGRFAQERIVNPDARVLVRRRKAEIEL